mmetsp:Transcript_1044/g.1479  ORF Transcript_1044/g.1479 Transcript_1044/m.1479 type:complete len:322 (-) Transcript_1044:61-1026(-)
MGQNPSKGKSKSNGVDIDIDIDMIQGDEKKLEFIDRKMENVPYEDLERPSLVEEEKAIVDQINNLQTQLDTVRRKQGKYSVKIAVPGETFSKDLSQDQSEHVTDEVFNAASHMVGFMLSLLGTVYLIAEASAHGAPWSIVSFSIYGACMMNLFISSTLHHGLHGSDLINKRFRMLDFCAIYPMIAGTYTPMCIVYLHGQVVGWVFLGSIWAIALMGMGLTIALFPDHLPKWVPFVFYITMGWMSVFLVAALTKYLHWLGLFLLILGGVFYTVGGIIYTSEKPAALIAGHFGFHEIWHIFVLLGAGSHFALMFYVVLPESYD